MWLGIECRGLAALPGLFFFRCSDFISVACDKTSRVKSNCIRLDDLIASAAGCFNQKRLELEKFLSRKIGSWIFASQTTTEERRERREESPGFNRTHGGDERGALFSAGEFPLLVSARPQGLPRCGGLIAGPAGGRNALSSKASRRGSQSAPARHIRHR